MFTNFPERQNVNKNQQRKAHMILTPMSSCKMVMKALKLYNFTEKNRKNKLKKNKLKYSKNTFLVMYQFNNSMCHVYNLGIFLNRIIINNPIKDSFKHFVYDECFQCQVFHHFLCVCVWLF